MFNKEVFSSKYFELFIQQKPRQYFQAYSFHLSQQLTKNANCLHKCLLSYSLKQIKVSSTSSLAKRELALYYIRVQQTTYSTQLKMASKIDSDFHNIIH